MRWLLPIACDMPDLGIVAASKCCVIMEGSPLLAVFRSDRGSERYKVYKCKVIMANFGRFLVNFAEFARLFQGFLVCDGFAKG